MFFPVRLLPLLLLALAGCSADQPLNPSFPLTLHQARAAIEVMSEAPLKLQRPVIVLGGYMDFGIGTPRVRATLREIGGSEEVISIHFAFKGSFDNCRDHLLSQIEAAFPSTDPNWTTEVDVVAGSMGGIVARYAALPVDENEKPSKTPRKQLKIARLFTISSPHLGARMSNLPSFDSLVLDMRKGSPFLARLDAALPTAGYELIPYVRLNDAVVGPENAAPPGRTPWWVANQPLQFSHLNSFRDERFLADISRRLRGEDHYTKEPVAPLPVK